MGLGLGPAWQINNENLGFGRIAMKTYTCDRKAKSVKAKGQDRPIKVACVLNPVEEHFASTRAFFIWVCQRSSRAL